MVQDEIQSIQKQIAELENRIQRIESFINGSTKGKPGRKSKLSLEQKNKIIEKHNQGISYSILSDEYGVSRSTISYICQGYKNLDPLELPIIPIRKSSEK